MPKTPQIPRLISESEDLRMQVLAKDKRIENLKAQNEFYKERLRLLTLQAYGASSEKSKALDALEDLFNEVERIASQDILEPTLEEITYRRKKRVGKRDADLSGLPVVRIDYELTDDERSCPKCGGALHEMSIDIHRTLERIPAKVQVTEHARHIYGCRCCEKDGLDASIIKAQALEPPIKNSIASPSLLASIAIDKYMKSLPLYRQEAMFKYEGIDFITRQNMANWMVKISTDWLGAIYDFMHQELIKNTCLHADETSIQVLHEDGKKPTSKSYMWLYRTSGDTTHPIVLYEYRKSRSYEHPRQFLKGFGGYLMCDGYSGYHKLKGITVVGCWAHARRYFTDSLKATPEGSKSKSLSAVGVDYCNRLFELEQQFVDMTAKERYAARLEKSKPVALELYSWAKTSKATPQSLIGKAMGYLLKQWPYLSNVFLDGALELSNNRAERSIKPFVIGRKNWLFANTKSGANASAIIYSIIETAKENNLSPYEYLKYLLEQLPNITTSKLVDVMPWSEVLPNYCKLPVDTKVQQ